MTCPPNRQLDLVKKKKGCNELAEALREYTSEIMASELTQKRIRDMDESRIEKKRKTLMSEWTEIQSNLHLLRRDLRDLAADDESKNHLECDIKHLVKHKNKLADELGFN